MSAPPIVIDTRLMPTFVSPNLLPRERLVRRVLEHEHARLLVVHGEAGAGKSSLLFDYARRSVSPVAWYSLQDTDRESKVFLTYLTEALHRTYPGAVGRIREQLSLAPSLDAAWEPVLTALVNDLTRYGERMVLVLDDYHLVQEAPIISEMVAFLVKNGPANLLLILATRRAPHLGLPYLRAKGLLVEVDGNDLRFTADEVEQVFRDVWNIPIDRAMAERLAERTEGWITGLQLVSQAIRGRSAGEVQRYVDDLQGKDQFIYDYLATEVYAQQPAEVRDFLKRTSILSRFNAPLAAMVSSVSDCAARLQYLENYRLFLVHLDPNREWFRYHHLFGDFLRRTLEVEEGAERVRGLHACAAAWFERHGDAASAVDHYLEAEDVDGAVRVLESRGAEMLSCGLQKSLEAWVDALPRDVRDASPALWALRGELRDLVGDWPRAVELYEKAAEQFRAVGRYGDVARVLENLLMCYIRFGEADRVLQCCEAALAECPPEDLVQRATMSAWLGAVLIYSGRDWDRGYALIDDSHQLAFKSGDPRAIAWTCVIYGFAYHFPQGNFLHAEKAFDEGIALFRSLGWSPMLYQLVMNKCVVLIFRGHLARARDLIEDTLAMAERNGHVFVVQGLEMCRAKLYLETGELHRCAESFSRLSERLVNAQTRAWYYRTLMLLRVRMGQMEAASVAAEEMRKALDLNGRGLYAPECLVALGCYHLGRDDRASAERTFEEALALSQRAQARFWEMKAHAWLAVSIGNRRGLIERLRVHVERALVLTRENDYVDAWLADTSGMATEVLVIAIAVQTEADYAREILERMGDRVAGRLQPLLGHPNARIRSVAVEYLGRVGSSELVDVLREARHDRSGVVRATVRKSLREHATARETIDIVTLGRFQVLRDGEPVHRNRVLPQRIFKYLLARYDATISLEALMEVFWPEQPPARARNNLNSNVNFLRKTLQPKAEHSRSLIHLDAQGYRLRLDDDVRLDVADFERLLAEATAMRRSGDLDAAHARYLRAEGLCKGGFFEEDVYEDWLQGRRERVEQGYREATTFLAERAMDAGHPGEAVEWYRKRLSRDPVDEIALQSLLRCHAAIGDRASARRDYEEFRRAMAESLDMEPSAETRLLMERLQAHG